MHSHCNRIMGCIAGAATLLFTMPVGGAEVPASSASAQEPAAPAAKQPDKKGGQQKNQPAGGDIPRKEQTPLQPVGQPPPEPAAEVKHPQISAIFEQPGVLTPRGTLVLEPSLQYYNSSSNRVALSGYTIIPSFTIGLIDVRNVNSNTYIAALGARYGITNRLEFEVKVPYVHRTDSTSYEQQTADNGGTIPASVFDAEGTDIGDVEFGPRFQLNRPGGDGPFFIGGVRVKSTTGKDPFEVTTSLATTPAGNQLPTELPTGSGFWGIQPSITAILPSDPAVFFGTISYMYNVERDVDGTKYDPGDTVGFNLGMGVGLNEKTSFSIGYDHVVLGKPKENGKEIPGSVIVQIGSLLVGCSYRLNEKTSINLSLGAGLTPAASNVQLTLRLPTSILLLD